MYYVSIYLHKHAVAKRRTAKSGGSQSGKNGLAAYWANVNATIACNFVFFRSSHLTVVNFE